jgi:putative addiction module component (TIGR02574 family)
LRRPTQERQRPRWLRSACRRAEEDLGVAERAVQNKGVSLSTNKTNFHELGNGFAGEFRFRSYSWLFEKNLLPGNIQLTNSAMETTFEDLKQLPVSEKIQLVEDLWDSIAAETSPIGLSSQHIAELDHRLDALEKNPRQGIPWSAVREKILAVL